MICRDNRDASVLFHFTCEGYFSSFAFIKKQNDTLSAFILLFFYSGRVLYYFTISSFLSHYFPILLTVFNCVSLVKMICFSGLLSLYLQEYDQIKKTGK